MKTRRPLSIPGWVCCAAALLAAACTLPPESPEPTAHHHTRPRHEAVDMDKLINSKQPIKVYFHSDHGTDDGSYFWVQGRYNGPKQFLGTVSPSSLRELLTAPTTELPDLDCYINMEFESAEGLIQPFTFYANMANEKPYIHILNGKKEGQSAPQLWGQLMQFFERKYKLHQRR